MRLLFLYRDLLTSRVGVCDYKAVVNVCKKIDLQEYIQMSHYGTNPNWSFNRNCSWVGEELPVSCFCLGDGTLWHGWKHGRTRLPRHRSLLLQKLLKLAITGANNARDEAVVQ
jgi:hypothetical protein